MMKTNTRKATNNAEAPKASTIKLGLDVHADSVSVVRQIDGASPQPAQKFKWERFWPWAAKQKQLAESVHSVYEAGPFGYGTHRRLEEMGISNLVVRPQNWDDLGKGVKTDKADALALAQRLDRYVNGNTKALAVVHVPTPEQEILRSQTRLREQLRGMRQKVEAQGRSMMLYYGVRVKGRWWGARQWPRLSKELPKEIRVMAEHFREIVLAAHAKVTKLTLEIEAAAPKNRPKGYGKLTTETLGREILDWSRFTNRRQVASITGLCPRVHSSGSRHSQGAISKHGNPRIRQAAIETAWRLCRFQPNYWALRRWQAALSGPSPAARKKAIVAIARHLVIDLWRLNTGRTTAEKLGLVLSA